ncbi:MAG: SGNH/GDSL hydrolase family protein [Deltaproteobacteria bacterium]|nr:SGNH/GDSL hydrolase family protein [Deltaproteobacteria bacterium]
MSTAATERPSPLPIWKRLLYSAIVLATLLTSLELLTRWTGADRLLFPHAFEDPYEKGKGGWWSLLSYDPVLDWRGRAFARLPGTDELLNERGFRGSDFRDQKPPGLRRVVCMGDSATFGLVHHGGFQFTYTPTYSSELQRLLNTHDARQEVHVVNAGIIGYSTTEGLRLLKHEVRYWHPDVITLRYGINDHLKKSVGYLQDFEPHSAILRWSEDSLFDLYIFQLFVRLKNVPLLAAVAALPAPDDTAPPAEGPVEVRVPLPDFEYNLRRLVVECRATGAKVVLMTAPLAPLVLEITSDRKKLRALGYPTYEDLVAEHRRYEDVVRAVAADLSVDLVDSSRELAARGLEQFFTRYDLAHPNGDGHVAIAQDLAALIRSKQLIPDTAPDDARATP